jgi:glycosyltransferase involved in cell wall biosynthesis
LPESEHPGRRPVVAFGQDWDTDPTSKHHLMRLLAAQLHVLWVEVTGMRAPSLLHAADLRRSLMKLRKIQGSRRADPRTVPAGMTIIIPPTIPLPTWKVAQAINARLYRRAIRKAIPAEPLPVLWVYMPIAARYLDQIPHAGLVYHCVDRWWAFDNYDSKEMQACHAILCQRADRVFVSSRELEQDCASLSDRVTYVPHGVEWDHFRTALNDLPPAPSGRPVIGFIGLLEAWVDLDLIAEIARRHPEADVVLVGAARVPTDALAAIPNIKLVGRRPFSELPSFLGSFDVALVPFLMNELTRAVNPLKLREYLAAGVPVVTTALPDLLSFRGAEGVDVVDTREAFLAAVARRLHDRPDPAMRRRLSDTMAGESWHGRLAGMLGVLGPLLDQKDGR